VVLDVVVVVVADAVLVCFTVARMVEVDRVSAVVVVVVTWVTSELLVLMTVTVRVVVVGLGRPRWVMVVGTSTGRPVVVLVTLRVDVLLTSIEVMLHGREAGLLLTRYDSGLEEQFAIVPSRSRCR
jgi:hypothetical protein